jgi:hypothetical protein
MSSAVVIDARRMMSLQWLLLQRQRSLCNRGARGAPCRIQARMALARVNASSQHLAPP